MSLRRMLLEFATAEVAYSKHEMSLDLQHRLEQLGLLAALAAAACLVIGYQVTAHERQLRSLRARVPLRRGEQGAPVAGTAA